MGLNDIVEMERLVRELESLGHRGSTTKNEHAAGELLLDLLRAEGLNPEVQAFPSYSSYGARIALHMVLAMMALLAIFVNAPVALFLTAFVLVSFLYETSTQGRILSRTIRGAPSRNVSARFTATGDSTKARVIVCAHMDTQRTGFIWLPGPIQLFVAIQSKLRGPAKAPLFGFVGVLLIQLALCGSAMIHPGDDPNWVHAIVAAYYVLACTFVVQWTLGTFVPGACDNASGVAAAVTLTRRWIDHPLPDVEFVVLFTGSEEVGCLGAAAWIDSQNKDFWSTPTCFLNLDTLGYGSTRLLASECAPSGWTLRYPTQLLEPCMELANSLGLSGVGPHSLPTQSDAFAFLVRGIPGITITTFEDGLRVPNYHQQSDVADQMSFIIAEQATGFAWRTLRTLADAITQCRRC